MKLSVLICLSAVICLAFLPTGSFAGKKKKKNTKKTAKAKGNGGFDSKTLKCLVCRAAISEFEAAIFKVDPKKMINSGSYRVKPDGSQKTATIPYARSQQHLTDLSEKICDRMEDYAQATWKKSGKPTLIRMINPDGNMNPDFSKVDVVNDEDLNTSLKFHVSYVQDSN